MSMKLGYEDSNTLEVVLSDVVDVCSDVGLKIQKRAGKVAKVAVQGKLDALRIKTDDETYTHMADDVQILTTTDKYGKPVVKVRGGRKTGSLWHIVNDGTYKNKATHFMDTALNGAEQEIENIIDEELRKAGF